MKLPLQVILPLGGIIVGGGIAVGVGLTNLALVDAFGYGHAEPVVFAGALMTIVMVVAALLSARYPDPEDNSEHHL